MFRRFDRFATGLICGLLLVIVASVTIGCASGPPPTSDEIQKRQQEKILQEGTSQIGMPAIVNFREKKLLKDILELRDQEGLVTYTYLENMIPTVVKGHTALGGKLTFVSESVGYAIPYATQFTNPEKVEYRSGYGYAVLPQADPNGLFSPASAEASWSIMKDPSSDRTGVVYSEPRLMTLPFRLPLD